MPTANFAVQPASFSRFDEWGCLWATDINHAYRLAMKLGEDAVIWRCPHQGEPMAWTTIRPMSETVSAH